MNGHDYELIDLGCGRRLERFGDLVLDRVAPAATGVPLAPQRWREADASFQIDPARGTSRSGQARGTWKPHTPRGLVATQQPWSMAFPYGRVEMRLTPFGHIGLFPEQRENWERLALFVRAHRAANILNLFAYTGASTLAVASAGGTATHIDASAGVVAWARRNAEASRLIKAPVRWIADDAMKFVERERRRGRHYHGLVLDPPSFGHGPRGESWQLMRDLPPLLDAAVALLDPAGPRCVLLTCHTTGVGVETLTSWLDAAAARNGVEFTQRETLAMDLETAGGARLASGCGLWFRHQ